MGKQFLAGIGVYEGFASLAVIEGDGDLLELKHVEEIPAGNSPFWFLNLLNDVEKKLASKLKKISFSFDGDPVILHTYPGDQTLARQEQDEHARWEMSQILPEYSVERYPVRLIQLQQKIDSATSEMLAIAIDGNAVSGLEDALRKRKFHIGSVMAEMTAVGRVLYTSHPEERRRRSAFVRLSMHGFELVRYLEGEIVDYSTEQAPDIRDLFEALRRVIAADAPEMLYVYGPGLTTDTSKLLRTAFEKQFMPLNPFRRLRITPSVQNFSRFLGKEPRFASAIGAALST